MAVQEQADIRTRKPLYKQLYFWVLVGITLGILLGHFFPAVAVQFEPLGTSFVNLIKMVIAPVIFCTVVVGIASMEDMWRPQYPPFEVI
jgi:aerobic C4-dicarboxylate transport protein